MASTGTSDISEETEIIINDPLASIYGMNCTWGFGNKLHVYAGKGKSIPQKKRTNLDGAISVHSVEWDQDMKAPHLRKLANESRNVFILLQKKAQQLDSSSLRQHILVSSRNYRAALKSCSLSLISQLNDTFDFEERAELDSQIQILEMAEIIWSLCEILCIKQSSNGVIVSQLLEWLHWTFPQTDIQYVLEHDPPTLHPNYWTVIYRLVLHGRINNARELLSLHHNKQHTAFTSIDRLLKNMPLLALFQGHTLIDIEMKWGHWQNDCRLRMYEGDFTNHSNIETIAKILVGDESVFDELKDVSQSWYQMLISKALYQNPSIQTHDLHHHSQHCIDSYGGNTKLSHLDNIISSLFRLDIHQVIKDSSLYLGNSWFVAHLTDILYHNNWAITQNNEYGYGLREHLVLDYASSLMSHDSLWQIAVDYFDYCPDYGRGFLELFIERLPFTTDKKARKIIDICETRGLSKLARSVGKIMSRTYQRRGNLGAALSWATQTKDSTYIAIITEKLMEDYTFSGDFSHRDLLDNLGASMLLSSKLTFFGKYREFHKLYQLGEFSSAASLLLSLLTSRLIPKQFILTVLSDALPLLGTEKPVFTSSQTYDLSYCLEDLLSTQRYLAKDSDTNIYTDAEQTKIRSLRMALTNNLARTVLQE